MNVNRQAASRDPHSGVQVPHSLPLALTMKKRKVHQPTEKEIKLPREEVPLSSPASADWPWPWGKTACIPHSSAHPSNNKAIKAVP